MVKIIKMNKIERILFAYNYIYVSCNIIRIILCALILTMLLHFSGIHFSRNKISFCIFNNSCS
jgi:hypothetical protein